MYDVVALGELLIDFAPKAVNESGYPVLSANPGGAPGNFLAALTKYGCRTAMIGKVGDDMFGRLLIRTLKDAGIETKGILTDPDQFTTLAFVSLDAAGNRDFSFARKPGADTCLKPEEICDELLADARVFHFGTLSLTDEPAASATRTPTCASPCGETKRTRRKPLSGASGRLTLSRSATKRLSGCGDSARKPERRSCCGNTVFPWSTRRWDPKAAMRLQRTAGLRWTVPPAFTWWIPPARGISSAGVP